MTAISNPLPDQLRALADAGADYFPIESRARLVAMLHEAAERVDSDREFDQRLRETQAIVARLADARRRPALDAATQALRAALPHPDLSTDPVVVMFTAAEYLRARRLTMLSTEAQEDILQFSEDVRAYLSGHSDSPDRALEIHARIEKALEPGDPRRRSVAALHKLLAGDAITMARVALSRAITASGGTATQALPLADLLHLGAAAIHKLMADPEGSRDLAPAEAEPDLGMAPEQDAEGREMEGKAHALLFNHDEPLAPSAFWSGVCPKCDLRNEGCASPTISCDGCGHVFTVEG